jgi:molybdopterin molybdotransferase
MSAISKDKTMVSVAEAEQIILLRAVDYGDEVIPFEAALGRTLAEDIEADRDLPPCNRVTMDGIAIRYATFEEGRRSFKIKAVIAAGEQPVDVDNEDECVEIMTGAALPSSLDTVVRYEDVSIQDGVASIITGNIKQGQNIHKKGKDKNRGDTVIAAGQVIDPAVISMAASVGKHSLLVKKQPSVVIISTGDELVAVDKQPTAFQVRSSNNHTISAVLQQLAVPCDMLHIPDEPNVTRERINSCLERYDVLLLCGGVSMGKFDYVPAVLQELQVTKLFHKVQQRPGKPFWFGSHSKGALVFAFPGNPVSAFLCLHRYFVPWLLRSQGSSAGTQAVYAVLDTDVTFMPPLQYFMQVKIKLDERACLLARPVEGNGSGDFANLLDSDAFMELPMEQSSFKKGEIYRIWPFKKIV